MCTKCHKTFTTKMGLNKHMNRKSPCVIDDNKTVNNKFNCKDCNRCFTTNQSLKLHISSRCPILKNKKTEGQLIENMQNKIEVLSETVNELKSKLNNQLISKNTTIHNGNNTNIHGNQNNNIQINNIIIPYGQNRIKESIILHSFLKDNTASQQYSKLPQSERYDNKNEKSNELLSSVLIEMPLHRHRFFFDTKIYIFFG